MAHWAKINDDNVVETVIVTSNDELDEGESWIAENLEGTWVKTSYNTRKGKHLFGGVPFRMNFAVLGGRYDADLDAFIPPKTEGEEDFILNSETMTWIPAPLPEDADWVMIYGPDPEFIEQTVQDENGNDIVIQVPVLPENAKVYYWYAENQAWAMNPDTPAPSEAHVWNFLEYEWQLPEGDRPGDNYYWDPIQKQWTEFTIPIIAE